MAEKYHEEIKNALEISDEELLLTIGMSDSYELSPIDSLRRGEAMYRNLKVKLRGTICESDFIVDYFSKEGNETTKVDIIAAIADSIAGYLYGVSPVTIAVLISREGIHNYCSNEKS